MNDNQNSPFEKLKVKLGSSSSEKLSNATEVVNYLITHFRDRAKKHKKFYKGSKYSSIALAALTTLITSLQAYDSELLPYWVLPLISTLATVSVTILGASSSQKNWTNSRTTQQQFEIELFLFNQNAKPYHEGTENNKVELFSKNIMDIWDLGHREWHKNIESK